MRDIELCNGPGKLCQALSITKQCVTVCACVCVKRYLTGPCAGMTKWTW